MIKRILHFKETFSIGEPISFGSHKKGDFTYAILIFGICVYIVQVKSLRHDEAYKFFGEKLVNIAVFGNSLPRMKNPISPPQKKDPLQDHPKDYAEGGIV